MKRQSGGALLMILMVIGVLAAYFALSLFNPQRLREAATAKALAEAKEAALGDAVKRAIDNSGVLPAAGLLPAPDLGSTRNELPNEGTTANPTLLAITPNHSIVGRLPWRTLGLPPLRDASGECLWYAVSGSGKNIKRPTWFNWDSIGHFEVFSPSGALTGPIDYHALPIALVISPGASLGAGRPPIGGDVVTECGGNYNASLYVENYPPGPSFLSSTPALGYAFGLATDPSNTPRALYPTHLANGPIRLPTGDVTLPSGQVVANDRILGITVKEIFDRVKVRSDFKSQIETMMGSLKNCLNGHSALPVASPGNKGINNVAAACSSGSVTNWQDNLLYATTNAAQTSVNGEGDCAGVLIFAGERTTRAVPPITAQVRVTAAQKGDATTFGDPAMYLEGGNAALFPNSGAYNGGSEFDPKNASRDIVKCIKGLGGAFQKSFNSDFGKFAAIGSGITPDPIKKTVTIAGGVGSGGCFWFNDPADTLGSRVPLIGLPSQGRTVRAYYEYQFGYADDYALTGTGTDRGHGFTFQMIRGDFGPPAICGSVANMGSLATNQGASRSFTFETDIRRQSGNGYQDPAENHTAIMVNGSLDHAGNISNACDGSKAGCRHTPANKFEEGDEATNVPPPSPHWQRIEIHSGCNDTCTNCNPATHIAPTDYMRLTAWVDCANCADVSTDYVGDELISARANRDFSAPGNWTGAGWTITGGALSHTGGTAAAVLPNTALTSPPAAGHSYRISLKIVTSSPGTLRIAFGGASTPAIALDPGTTVQNIQLRAVSAAPLTITPSAAWTGSIDNASLAEGKQPTVSRCMQVPPASPPMTAMNQVYFGFTGGFLPPPSAQSVTIKNFYLRSE